MGGNGDVQHKEKRRMASKTRSDGLARGTYYNPENQLGQ